jgi:hypothetical protein
MPLELDLFLKGVEKGCLFGKVKFGSGRFYLE